MKDMKTMIYSLSHPGESFHKEHLLVIWEAVVGKSSGNGVSAMIL